LSKIDCVKSDLFVPKKTVTERFQVGPTLTQTWQVLDLHTGMAAVVSGLHANSMCEQDARLLCLSLNAADDEDDGADFQRPAVVLSKRAEFPRHKRDSVQARQSRSSAA
jgi:hypothetical protein